MSGIASTVPEPFNLYASGRHRDPSRRSPLGDSGQASRRYFADVRSR